MSEANPGFFIACGQPQISIPRITALLDLGYIMIRRLDQAKRTQPAHCNNLSFISKIATMSHVFIKAGNHLFS